jgi:hypothetical protein
MQRCAADPENDTVKDPMQKPKAMIIFLPMAIS